MGLFGKKLEKALDEPMMGEPHPPLAPPASTAIAPELSSPVPALIPPSRSAPAVSQPVAAAPVAPARAAYGIDDAIRLMRSLPVEQNAELVVRVMRSTLESMNVQVGDIVADAERKESEIQERIATLRNAIAEFEKEIRGFREEMGRLQSDLAETSSVKQRLRLTENGNGSSSRDTPLASTIAKKAEPAAAQSSAPAASAAPVLSGAIPPKASS